MGFWKVWAVRVIRPSRVVYVGFRSLGDLWGFRSSCFFFGMLVVVGTCLLVWRLGFFGSGDKGVCCWVASGNPQPQSLNPKS